MAMILLEEGSDDDDDDDDDDDGGTTLATPSAAQPSAPTEGTTAGLAGVVAEGVAVAGGLYRMEAGSGDCSFDSDASESGRYSATSIEGWVRVSGWVGERVCVREGGWVRGCV